MTTKQINDRIARLCGWEKQILTNGFWKNPNSVSGFMDVPNYTKSLDACREFEDDFSELELTEYGINLRRIVARNVERDKEPKKPDTIRTPDGRYYCAKPLERCEAFLRMEGQWNDSALAG